MSDQVRVNGNQHSWGSIILKAGGQRFYGFTSISYGDKRERVKAYGMGQHHAPRGRSRGKYTTDPVKIKGWTASVQELREQLALLAPDKISYGDVEIEVVVEYVDTGEKPLLVECRRCVWISNNTSNEENPDPLSEEFELDTMQIRRNGKVLFDASRGAP